MKTVLPGIHHVTAISGPPRKNVDFYAGLLGLRLVKKTVNFDDPGTYHLYYGDELGNPGTILTFFPWAGVPAGRAGAGTTGETAFSVPDGALDFWMGRFADLGVECDAPGARFGEGVLPFRDPDGLRLALVGDAPAGAGGWTGGAVPPEHAVRAFQGVTLLSAAPERTARVLTDVFGWTEAGEEAGRVRFRAPGEAPGRVVDLLPPERRAISGAGTVHHVAFRARDAAEQLEWRERVSAAGLSVTPVQERNYFRSIYFREPGGVLFEIATDPPGFTVDEAPASLGTALKLPSWLEPQRARIEAHLPPLPAPRPTSTAPTP